MAGEPRRRPTRNVQDGWARGPDAPIAATAAALTAAATARAVVLVEGISDQVALETLAARQGRDLTGEGVVVVPVGGAHAVTRYLVRFGPAGAGLTVAGLCDAAEEPYLHRGLAAAGFTPPADRLAMERLGFFVCDDDLEDELVRASGRTGVEAVLDACGDLASLSTLRQQPAWRDARFEAQVRRWLGAGSGRKLRYAQRFVHALPADRLPRPLVAVLARTA